ncbi:MAG TPA: DUF1801 domain-containing protein [Planctomycetota bacterium]|nr:DUF1801 domain-containing protein [Planctomycetota bacterium]
MQSKATTVAEYLDSLPPDRRIAIAAVRKAIVDNLDPDYAEGMHYGMISYCVPHRLFPPGYHCNPKQPLPFAALASQKNHMSLHLMGVYTGGQEADWFREAWEKSGKKLDIGKCCVRFRSLDEVPLDVVGEAIRRMPAKRWVGVYMEALASMQRRKAGGPAKQTTERRAKIASKTPAAESARKAKARPGAKKAKADTRT